MILRFDSQEDKNKFLNNLKKVSKILYKKMQHESEKHLVVKEHLFKLEKEYICTNVKKHKGVFEDALCCC